MGPWLFIVYTRVFKGSPMKGPTLKEPCSYPEHSPGALGALNLKSCERMASRPTRLAGFLSAVPALQAPSSTGGGGGGVRGT